MFFFLISVVLFGLSSAAHAAAWTVAPGEWERYHEITYYSTDYYYDTEGNRRNQARYTKYENSNRIEYGLYDGLTLGGSFQLAAVKGSQDFLVENPSPFFGPTTVTVTRWNVGLADPKFYARQRLWQNDTSVVSTQGTVKLPSIFRWTNLPRSGSDEYSLEARLLGGHSFQAMGQDHFANAEVAYEWRPENAGDLIHADLTAGFKVDESFIIMPQIFSTWRAGGNNTGFTQTGDDSYDLVKAQLSGVVPLTDRLSLQFGGFHHAYGRNTGGGSGATISLWVKP